MLRRHPGASHELGFPYVATNFRNASRHSSTDECFRTMAFSAHELAFPTSDVQWFIHWCVRMGGVQKVCTSNVTSLRRSFSWNTIVTKVEVQDTDFLDIPILFCGCVL